MRECGRLVVVAIYSAGNCGAQRPQKPSGSAGISSFWSTNLVAGAVFFPWYFPNGKRILITNIHISPSPAEAVVTIWYQGKLVKRAALSSRHISISVSDLRLTPSRLPFFRRFLHICVSAPGHRYAQTRVKLYPFGGY